MISGGSLIVILGVIVGVLFSSVWLSFSRYSLYRLIGDICISMGIGVSLCLVIGSLICLIPIVIYLAVDLGTHFYFRSVNLKNSGKNIFEPRNIVSSMILLIVVSTVGYFISIGILEDMLKLGEPIRSVAELGDLYRKNIIENMLFTSTATLTVLSISIAGFLLNKKDGSL